LKASCAYDFLKTVAMECADSKEGSFTTRRVNRTTFVVQEDDRFVELPLIYVKLHPHEPVIILSDTGSDAPKEEHWHGRSSQTQRPSWSCSSVQYFEASDGAGPYDHLFLASIGPSFTAVMRFVRIRRYRGLHILCVETQGIGS